MAATADRQANCLLDTGHARSGKMWNALFTALFQVLLPFVLAGKTAKDATRPPEHHAWKRRMSEFQRRIRGGK